MDYRKLLDKFYEYHSLKVQKGYASSFDGIEQLALSYFVEWLTREYNEKKSTL